MHVTSFRIASRIRGIKVFLQASYQLARDRFREVLFQSLDTSFFIPIHDECDLSGVSAAHGSRQDDDFGYPTLGDIGREINESTILTRRLTH